MESYLAPAATTSSQAHGMSISHDTSAQMPTTLIGFQDSGFVTTS